MRILIIDNDPNTAYSLAKMLEAFGHEARGVVSAADAEALLASFKADAVLCDPAEDTGHALCQQLQADPRLEGALWATFTGYDTPEAREQARAAGFDLFFVKPGDVPEMLAALEAALQQRRGPG